MQICSESFVLQVACARESKCVDVVGGRGAMADGVVGTIVRTVHSAVLLNLL